MPNDKKNRAGGKAFQVEHQQVQRPGGGNKFSLLKERLKGRGYELRLEE